jgi:hypothetical protein
MTNSEEDFIKIPKTVEIKIKVIKGYLKTLKIGTVRCLIQDDDGRAHQFDIPGTYLVHNLPICLLSSQHVTKKMMTNSKDPEIMKCSIYANKVLLTCYSGKYERTIIFSLNNVLILWSGPGFKNYEIKSTQEEWSSKTLQAFSVNVEASDDFLEELSDIQPLLIDENIEEDTTINKVKPEDTLMVGHLKLARIPFKTFSNTAKLAHLSKTLA